MGENHFWWPCWSEWAVKYQHENNNMVFVRIFFGTFFPSHLVAFPSQIAKLTPWPCVVKSTNLLVHSEGRWWRKYIGESAVKYHMSPLTKTQGSVITVQYCWIHQNLRFLTSTISPESTINLPRRKLSKGMFPASDYVRFKDEVGFGLTEIHGRDGFFGEEDNGCTLDLRVLSPVLQRIIYHYTSIDLSLPISAIWSTLQRTNMS